MSEDLKLIDEQYRNLIFSLNIESNDIKIVKAELDKQSENIHCIFMYLTSLIAGQIDLLSPTYDDHCYLVKLVSLFCLIREDFKDVTHLISKSHCIWLTGNALEKLNTCAIYDKGAYNYVVIQCLINLIKEQLIIYPKEVGNKIGDSILIHALMNTFSDYATMRYFIYYVVPLKRDFFSTLQANISLIFNHITKELPKAKNSEILNELVAIAGIFSCEFKGIYNDFYLILNQLIYFNNIHEENQTFKLFFKSLLVFVFKDENAYCFEIVNLMLQLYEEHINEQGICRLIISSLFSKLPLAQYYLISDNSDLVAKFISQFYKSKDTYVIEFYFKWLDMSSRTKETIINRISNNGNSNGTDNIMMHQKNPLAREFKALGKILPLFEDNTPMLLSLCNQLKLIFSFQKDYLIQFLDQIEVYQGVHAMLKTKASNAAMLFHFIKDLLQIYVNESIFIKVTQANLLQFDFCSNDELVYDKIYLSLIYETNQDKFNTKCDKIVEKLGHLSFEIQNRRDCFDENVTEFIDIFNILLQCFLNEKNRKITPITVKLFKDIADLLLDFFIVLFEYEVELRYAFKLWNTVFDFVFNYSLTLWKNKLKENDSPTNDANANATLSLEVPQIISKEHLKKAIYEGLSKCNKGNSIMLLRYLYGKCLNFKSTEYEFEYPEKNVDPLQLIKFKYVFPQTFAQHNGKRFSFLFLESQMLLKCMVNVIFSMANLDNTLSLFLFLDFLCEINCINSPLMLRCGIVKALLKQLGISEEMNKRVYSLVDKLIRNFNKEDMEIYLKQVYVLLIKESNLTTSLDLLRIIYSNIDKAASTRNSITLSSINSNNPQLYQVVYMPHAVNCDTFNMMVSLYTPSFRSLNKFYLCHLGNSNCRFCIIFDKDNLDFYLNEKLIQSFPFFNNELNQKYNAVTSKMNEADKWHNFIIETGNDYNHHTDKAITTISFPHSVLLENKPPASLSLSIGYLNCKPFNSESLSFGESIAHVDISYLLLMKESIPYLLAQEIDNKQINYSKGKSIAQIQSFATKDPLGLNKENGQVKEKEALIEAKTAFNHQDIIAEILFNRISLENGKHIPMILEKRSTLYNIEPIDKQDYFPYISCNTCSKQDSKLYLLKRNSFLEYAAMNSIYTLGSLCKSHFRRKLNSFYSTLDLTLNNVFFADIFYAYLIEMNSDLFARVYHMIFNIILKAPNFSKQFFSKYINTLPCLFVNNAAVLDKDFVTCLLMNPEIPLGTLFIGQCIEIIYLNPHLFPLLSKDIQLFFLEKLYIYFHSSDITNSLIEFKLFFKLIKKLIDLLMHSELNKEISELVVNRTKEIINMLFNTEKAKLNEYEILFSQFSYYLIVISNYAKYKDKGININTPDLLFLNSQIIFNQMKIISPLLNTYTDEYDTNLVTLSEDDCYLIEHFKIEFSLFKKSLKAESLYKKNRKTLRLIWPELFTDYDDYTWSLSSKEGYCRMRKKIVLKENDMKITDDILAKKIFSYEKYWIWLEKMALYELYSSSPLIKHMINSNDRYQNSYMCLLIKNNIKTESLLILGDKSLYIITNVIVDNKKRFHLSKAKTSNLFWARDDNDKEWDRLVVSDKKKSESVSQFNFNSVQIKIKAIRYIQISQLHKKKHLHQKNSIELFTLQGSSYFITVFPKHRDDIFAKILKNIDDQSENTNIKNMQKASGSNVIYLKHYPVLTMRSKTRKKPDVPREKAVIETKTLTSELQEKWSQFPMSNFNYLMTINTLSGRSYNDLTQYFIFPWMLKDFFTEKLDPSLDVFYRDFSFPLHSQSKSERELIKKKYDLKVADDKFGRERFNKILAEKKRKGVKIGKDDKYTNFPILHCGNYYSNFSFVCYYLFRINPFTSIAFSVKGTFDQGDRCFNCLSFFSAIKTKYQEWVPELFYFPELLVNINNQQLGTMTVDNKKKSVNDISIPPWADMDPRTVAIIFEKILESSKVSGMMSYWIDLIFGYKLTGKDSIESLNSFSEACYPYEDLKKKRFRNKELGLLLNETENMGCCPIQLFNKPHAKKIIAFEPYSYFYDKNTSIALVTVKSNDLKCNISTKSIGDFKAKYELPRFNTSNGEGGLSSLHQYIDRTFHDDLDEDLKQKRTYYAVGKNKSLIGPKFNLILSNTNTSLYITMPKYSLVFEYNLNESSPIDQAISSINGKFIIVGLSNGTVIKYRKKNRHKETIAFPPSEQSKQKTVIKKVFDNSSRENASCNPKYAKYKFYENASIKDFDFWLSVPWLRAKNKSTGKKHLKQYYLLEEARTGIPINSIIKMDLCESYSFLLVVDQLNFIYQYDFNQMKLLYKFRLKTVCLKYNYPIKYAKIIHKSGDYVIGTKYSLHLFSINGLPLAEMNIFDILKPCLPITSIEAVAVSNTIVFTGHSNGEVNIWRLKTDPYELTSSENDLPLFKTFHQRYQNSFKEKTYSFETQKREFDDMKTIRESQSKIILIKLTDAGNRLYFIDKEKKIFRLSNDDYMKNKINKSKSKGNTQSNNTNIQSSSKAICKQCKKVCEETCSSVNSSGLCSECSHSNSNSSSDRLVFDF